MLNIDSKELAELGELLNRSEVKSILYEAAAPLLAMEKTVRKGYEELAKQNPDNHTHFVELDEVDPDTGRRKLRFHRHPSRMSMQDHIDAIENRMHRRRLSRNARPRNTGSFERRLSDHIEELQGHVRHLQLACPQGMTSTRCVSENLQGLVDELGTMSTRVTDKLTPVNDLLDKLDRGQDDMDKVEKVGSIVVQAVGIATKIPGAVGQVFKLVDNGMKPVQKTLQTIDDKGTAFENSVGKLWQNSIGRVDDLITSFDSGVVFYTIAAASAAAEIQDSVCLSTLIEELSGANLVGAMERAMNTVKNYVEALYNGIMFMLDALESTTWRIMSDALDGVVKAVEPVRK